MEITENIPKESTISPKKDTSIDTLVRMTGFYRYDGVEFKPGEMCRIVHGENGGTITHLIRMHDRVTLYVPDSKFEKVE